MFQMTAGGSWKRMQSRSASEREKRAYRRIVVTPRQAQAMPNDSSIDLPQLSADVEVSLSETGEGMSTLHGCELSQSPANLAGATTFHCVLMISRGRSRSSGGRRVCEANTGISL